MPRFLNLALLLLAYVPAICGQSAPAVDQNALNQQVQQMMSVEVAFEQMLPPGTSIEAKEIYRERQPGKGLIVKYHIFIKGVPPDTLFQQLSWPVNADKPTAALPGISVGKDGLLICAGRREGQCGEPSNPDDPIDFVINPLRGEPSRFAFVSEQKPDLRIGTVLTPDPVQATDKGCTLSVVRLTPQFELGFFEGSGYPPNTDVHYRFSTDQSIERTIKSDAKGVIRIGLLPPSKNPGTARFKIMEPTCSPEVSYEWGVF